MTEIGLSGLLLDSPYSGTATYTNQLTTWLPHVAPEFSFRLFTHSATPQLGIPVDHLASPFTFARGSRFGARLDKLAWETITLPVASALRGQALLHSLYFAAPPVAASPLVVTIHDVIPLAMLGHHRGRQPAIYGHFMAWTARRAAAIITVSEHSKRDIIRLLAVPENRVFVTPEAADECFFAADDHPVRSRYGLPERFLLYLGGAERRKNIETLVRAFAGTRVRRDGVRLVIVARFPPADRLYPDIPALIRELGLNGTVTIIPAVDEEDKPALFRAAAAFCYPSRYEGFGLPPLEAMAAGTPVLAAAATSLPEVLGTAACLLPPDDVEAWAGAMDEIAGNESRRETLIAAGRRRASQFSWRRTAEGTAAVYRQVLG